MDRISAEAYLALREALPVVTWYKNNFEYLLRTLLAGDQWLLDGLDFAQPKRATAEIVVQRLAENEERCSSLTLRMMRELGAMTHFPDIEGLDEPLRSERLPIAREAVGRMSQVLRKVAELELEQLRRLAAQSANATQEAVRRQFASDLATLKDRFLTLDAAPSAHRRGLDFEPFLTDVFRLFDMAPRNSYVVAAEQIDGSFSFDTDDFIVEAKWWANPVSRAELDVFSAKIARKAKNVMGLFVAVNGFSSAALQTYREGTPFLTMDGTDLFAVLDGQVRLDGLLRAKKRHASETGNCFYPAREWLNAS